MGSNSYQVVLVQIAPLLVIWLLYAACKARQHHKNAVAREESIRNGLNEPASLHPVINPNRCVGCGSCVKACPEQAAHTVLGLIGGRSHLISPSCCIGHGACKAACPMDAITLVFGTEKRGVDIPLLTPEFESTVPGIFVAGELGGMGLIRNAIEQGKQAVESIRRLEGIGREDQLDLVIVGAGPAGFAASLAATEHRLRCVTVEQETLGGTVAHYPRGKLVMTSPATLPLAGKMSFTEVIKEELIAFWQEVERSTAVSINYRERMEGIKPVSGGFEVKTDRETYRCRAVLLAIGRRGTPRKLGVPGETSPKVVYRMIDPEQYRGQHVLVVGGGDSALEAATSIAAEPGTTVTLSYRSEQFSRAKAKNRQKVTEAQEAGRLTVWMKSEVKEVTERGVRILTTEGEREIENDGVIVCVGGTLPTPFLEKIGVTVETKHGTP